MDVGLFVYTKIGLWKISINPKNYRTKKYGTFLCCKQSISYFKAICTKMGLLVFLKIWWK